jgi:hypothetical protein
LVPKNGIFWALVYGKFSVLEDNKYSLLCTIRVCIWGKHTYYNRL